MKVQLLELIKININFSKANSKFCLILHYNADNSYLFVNGKETLSLKSAIKILTSKHNFVLEAYLMDLALLSLVSLNENVCDFSVDYNSIDKSDILRIHD